MKAFSLIELILYIAFISFVWLASFNILWVFFDLNKQLEYYKNLKKNYIQFENDFINLYIKWYKFYSWWNKLILSWDNLIWYICSWTLQKVYFDNSWNANYTINNWNYVKCLYMSWYYKTWINLDLKIYFLWTGLNLHYYFK